MKKLLLALILLLTNILAFGINEKGFVEKHKEVDKAVEEELKSGKLTLNDPFIMINPYDMSPLTALAAFDTETDSEIEVTVKGRNEVPDFSYKIPGKNKNYKFPIYGLFVGDNSIEIKSIAIDGKVEVYTGQLKTEQTPSQIMEIEVLTNEKEADNRFLLTMTGRSKSGHASAYDNYGNIRWYLSQEMIGGASCLNKMKNGHFLLRKEKISKFPYSSDGVYEIDVLGKIYRDLKLHGHYHHEIIELPNGEFLAAVDKVDSGRVEDYIIRYDKDGNVIVEYDLIQIMGMKDPKATQMDLEYLYKGNKEKADVDWAHINGVVYDSNDNSMIISARNLSALIKIGLDTKDLIWIIADPNLEWIQENHKEKLLTPKDKNFKFFYGQHGIKVVGINEIILYDNGVYSDLYRRGIYIPDDSYDPSKNISRGMGLKITDNIFELTWEHIEDGIYTPYIGDVNKIGDNHYTITFGGITTIDNKAVDNIMAPDFPDGKIRAIIVEIKDGKVVYKVESKGNNSPVFRANKVDLF